MDSQKASDAESVSHAWRLHDNSYIIEAANLAMLISVFNIAFVAGASAWLR